MPGLPFAPDEAVHVMHGDSGMGRWARDFVVLRDMLSVGRSDTDPGRHLACRRAEWRAEGDEFLGTGQVLRALRAYPRSRPILLWTTKTWRDRLTFWWTLEALRAGKVPPTRVWVCEPRHPSAPEHRMTGLTIFSHEIGDLGSFNPEQLHAAFSTAFPLRAARLRAGASLWRKYSSPSPQAFDRARRAGSVHFEELSRIGDAHGFAFPRLLWGRLHLSELDRLCLSPFRAGWARPIDALRVPRKWREIIDAMALYGDHFVFRRMRQWATVRRRGPILETRAEPAGTNQLTDVSYRLSPRGTKILERGLERPDDAPSLFVGGCQVYTPRRPWAKTPSGSGWRLERL